MSRLKMFWSNCVTTFILIVGMSFQYTKTMDPNQNTVAKHFANIQEALANLNNDDLTLYNDANELFKTIFCRNSCPNTFIKISINEEGTIDYNKLTKRIPIDPKVPPLSNFKDIITDEEINSTILKQEDKIYRGTIHESYRSLYSNENLQLIRTIVKRFLPEENDEIAKKNLKQAEEFIALNTQMNAYVSYWNPQNNAAPLCSYILSCILDYIKKKDNLMYQYYEPEKQAPKGKSHSTNLMLIGGCGSLILLLSAVLYWFYKK